MKKTVSLLLTLCLCLLCSCSGGPGDTTGTAAPPTTAAGTTGSVPSSIPSTGTVPSTDTPGTSVSTAPSTEATKPPYTHPELMGPSAEKPYMNPLTGEGLAEPFTNRVFAVSINNVPAALPHRGIYQADIYMEMFVNHSVVRGLALYSDISKVEAIGSVRSTRPIFTDIAGHFDLFVAHAGGSATALKDQLESGIDNMNIDTIDKTTYSFRDKDRPSAWEHTLFAKGAGLVAAAEKNGFAVTQKPGKSYGMSFTDDGTPDGGEAADTITITFRSGKSSKITTMVYDAELGRYVYHQYDQAMADADNNAAEAFENVIILLGQDTQQSSGFHIFDFLSGGEGYFACGGKIIPIQWSCAGADQPWIYTTLDGEPLELGVGSTYIAIAPLESDIVYH